MSLKMLWGEERKCSATVVGLVWIFSFSTGNYADQIKPLIQRTPTGGLSTVACFKTLPMIG